MPSVIRRSILSLGKRSLVDMMMFINTHNSVSMDINLHQFSGNMHPLGAHGMTGIHRSVVDVVVSVNAHNESMTRGNPLEFSGYMNPPSTTSGSVAKGSLSVVDVVCFVHNPYTSETNGSLNSGSTNPYPTMAMSRKDLLAPVNTPDMALVTAVNVC